VGFFCTIQGETTSSDLQNLKHFPTQVDLAIQTSEEKQAECRYLNEVRANFTFCCRYPLLVIWGSVFLKCEEYCVDKFIPKESRDEDGGFSTADPHFLSVIATRS
jgi:hypothetical protein